jgi:hypothetical protein
LLRISGFTTRTAFGNQALIISVYPFYQPVDNPGYVLFAFHIISSLGELLSFVSFLFPYYPLQRELVLACRQARLKYHLDPIYLGRSHTFAYD